MEPFSEVQGIVLAGGKSSRFGSDKALATIDGTTLIERAVASLRPLFRNLLVITNHPEAYAFLGLPLARDVIEGLGPLGGIYTALKRMEEPYAFVVACDMPDLNADLIRLLVGLRRGYDVVAPRLGKWIEPLHAVYSKKCLEPVEECVREGARQIIRFYPRVRVRYVDEQELRAADPMLRSFCNINTQADLRAVRVQPKSPPRRKQP